MSAIGKFKPRNKDARPYENKFKRKNEELHNFNKIN